MQETLEIVKLIDMIYGGLLNTPAWETAIKAICWAFGGERAALTLHDVGTQHVESAIYIDIDHAYQQLYAHLTCQQDMSGTFCALAANSELGALTGNALARAAPDFERSRFHCEWLGVLNLVDFVAVPLVPTASLVGWLFIGRPAQTNQYADRELGALCLLRPHVIRAVQVRQHLQDLERIAQTSLEALERVRSGVMLVDKRATVVHANRAARSILEASDGIGLTCAVLACDEASDTRRLLRLVGEAATGASPTSGGPMAVRRRSGRRPLSVLTAPLRGEHPVPFGRRVTAIVMVNDPDSAAPSPSAALGALYGLTAAEARVAATLLDHRNLAEVARKLGTSLTTVRTLLQRVFEKTETHRQADLIRLMLAHSTP